MKAGSLLPPDHNQAILTLEADNSRLLILNRKLFEKDEELNRQLLIARAEVVRLKPYEACVLNMSKALNFALGKIEVVMPDGVLQEAVPLGPNTK